MTGKEGQLCTSGGTSDGRFLAAVGSQVVELGPTHKTIHKQVLSDIYVNLLERLLPPPDTEEECT